jgi:predicted ATPase
MIRSLQLRNFKCFKNQSIDFAPLTLLSGLNGMGKSSVLQALLLLRQSYEQKLLQDTGLALNGSLVQIGTATDAFFRYADKDEISFTVSLDNGVEGKWRFKYNSDKDVLDYAFSPVAADIFEYSLFTDRFHYLQAERIGPRTAFPKSDFLVREHKQMGTRGEHTAHFLELFGSKDKICCSKLAFPGVDSQKLKEQVEAWLGQISPGTRLHLATHSSMDLMNLQYSFTRAGEVEDVPYRATNVGFGITYVLPVIVALLSSSPGALVLLENPEAHLHPQGQVKMGELIARAASCGIQVVVETHSDHVLNGILIAVHAGLLEPDKIDLHFFQRSNKPDDMSSEIISPKVNRDGRLDQWPDGFFDEWDKSVEILLGPSSA